jgi:hypothetical protein
MTARHADEERRAAGQLATDLDRDILARHLEPRGIEPVRMVAVDEVWSAMRFRPAR